MAWRKRAQSGKTATSPIRVPVCGADLVRDKLETLCHHEPSGHGASTWALHYFLLMEIYFLFVNQLYLDPSLVMPRNRP